jgi:hypothetical protein
MEHLDDEGILDDIDDSDEADVGFNVEALRKYEKNKMKYYYAVIYTNSPKTSKSIYEEFNGIEFELSGCQINLSYIADDIEFSQKAKESCSVVPQNYQFDKAQRLNKALSQSMPKLTWDQTDP